MKLEKPNIHWKSYDVLAHQIVGMTFENDDLKIEDIWKTIKRCYAYKDLTYEEFENILRFLEEIRLIRIVDGKVKRTKKGLHYYFENLSMIPDEKSYDVIDIVTNKKIGILHEEFIAKHGNPGTVFILRGLPWKIEKIEKNKVYVSLEKDFESAIPSWEGELIPVPFEVAQLATEIKKNLLYLEELKDQKRFFIPSKNKIYIESYRDWIIIHAPFGTKVNDTLSRVLGYIISIKYGTVIGIKSDPYRILIKSPFLTKEKVKNILYELKNIKEILKESIKYTDLFLWKFTHVAKRMGIIRKDAEYSKSTLRRIAETLEGTPVFEETIRELIIDKFDIEKTEEILNKIKKNEIEVEIIEKEEISPLAKLALEGVISDVILTKEKYKEILELVKERLYNTTLGFMCMNCYRVWKDKVKNFKGKCSCGSIYISVFKEKDFEYVKELSEKLKKEEELDKAESRFLNLLYLTADLNKEYGKKFLLIYAGKGISVSIAIHILKKGLEEENLIKEIINYEKKFFKIKRYY